MSKKMLRVHRPPIQNSDHHLLAVYLFIFRAHDADEKAMSSSTQTIVQATAITSANCIV